MKKLKQEIIFWTRESLGIALFISILIGLLCAVKWLSQPYIEPCQEYTKKEYWSGDIPVRCNDFWKETPTND